MDGVELKAPPFVVFALPRSRTYWLSRFLSYGDWSCGHDEARHFRGLDDVRSFLAQECVGTVETGVASWWRLLQKYRPNAKVVVVRRKVPDVVDSLMAIDMRGTATLDRLTLTQGLQRVDAKLGQIAARWPGALEIDFHDLVFERGCKAVFEHCLPYAHDRGWWERFDAVNLQRSVPEMTRYYKAHQPQLDKIAAMATQVIRASWALQPVANDGIVFQTETLETLLRDAVALFAEHALDVGEAPDSYLKKNIAQAREAEKAGNLQITTARQNGRIFGYLMTIETPSWEAAGERMGVQTLRYASSLFPGLGLKIERAALANSKARGLTEAFMMAGPRGSGARIRALYKRVGAVEAGEMFRLNLREV